MHKMRVLHVGLLCLSAHIFAQVEDKKMLTHDFDVRGELEVENNAGHVTVTGSDVHNKITIEVTRRANTKEELALFDAKFDVSDKETKAKVKSDNLKRVKNASIDFNIIVPRYTEVYLDLDAGNAIVQNIKGQMKVEVKAGNASISGARKEVEVRVGAGDIQVAYAADGFGKTDVKTDGGNISVIGAGGSVDAKSGSGAINIDQRVLPNKEDIDAKTNVGDVSINLPSDVNATIKAETKLGKIVDGGLQWMRKMPKEGKEPAEPKLNDEGRLVLGKGYADIDLETKNGGISVSLK